MVRIEYSYLETSNASDTWILLPGVFLSN